MCTNSKLNLSSSLNSNPNLPRTPVIYLSPSNQPANRYAVGNTNEKREMEAVARQIQVFLEEYHCTAIIATLPLGIDSTGRPKEAREKGADIYLAIHSNAGGGGKGSGAMTFYHPQNPGGQALAASIVEELNAVCPIPSNRTTPVQSGMDVFQGAGYAEIRLPYQYGLCPVLAETNFHDNPKTAQWMIDHKDVIAIAYVQALVKTLGLIQKSSSIMPSIKEGNKVQYYRVQVGAFLEKSNAEALQRKLKAAGYDAIIKKD